MGFVRLLYNIIPTFLRCPVDTFVFPELGRSRDGDSLEARFNAFKIPESNFLVFEATVKTCRDGCQPAYCNGASGRSEPSFGRRKRSLNDTLNVIESEDIENDKENATLVVEHKGMISVIEVGLMLLIINYDNSFRRSKS